MSELFAVSLIYSLSGGRHSTYRKARVRKSRTKNSVPQMVRDMRLQLCVHIKKTCIFIILLKYWIKHHKVQTQPPKTCLCGSNLFLLFDGLENAFKTST